MQIDCPTCARSYHVGRHALGAGGRMVVCASCTTRWHVTAPYDDPRLTQTASIAATSTRRHAGPARPDGGARARQWSSLWRPVAISVACACLLMLVIGKRTAIVTAAPRTAALYAAVGLPVNVRGLEIAALKTTRLDDAAQHVEISGRIRNIAAAPKPVPRITFDVRNASGATLATWTETAPKRMLADNESIVFTTQAPALPEGTKDVVVRFAADQAPDSLLIHKPR